jgi:hypothetical protein
MSLQTELVEKIARLPEDQQMLLKSLVDTLVRGRQQAAGKAQSRWFGSLEHLGVSVGKEDIAEARREMWGNFPREIGL